MRKMRRSSVDFRNDDDDAPALGEGRRPAVGRRPCSGCSRPCRPACSAARPATAGGAAAERLVARARTAAAGSSGTAGSTTLWGDAEILLAVEEATRGTGAGGLHPGAPGGRGGFPAGLNYVVNVVRDTHPERAAVTDWFLAPTGSPASTTVGWCKRAVAAAETAQRQRPPRNRPGGAARRRAAGALRTPSGTERPPARRVEDARRRRPGRGHEESGGYVEPGAAPLLIQTGRDWWRDVTMSGVEAVEGPVRDASAGARARRARAACC